MDDDELAADERRAEELKRYLNPPKNKLQIFDALQQDNQAQRQANLQASYATRAQTNASPLPLLWSGSVPNGTVLRWISKGKYAYVAIWISSTSRWYLTGRGEWYHSNELTMDQMNEVLARDEVTDVEAVANWTPAHQTVPPF